jgi:hypothetical protein
VSLDRKRSHPVLCRLKLNDFNIGQWFLNLNFFPVPYGYSRLPIDFYYFRRKMIYALRTFEIIINLLTHILLLSSISYILMREHAIA